MTFHVTMIAFDGMTDLDYAAPFDLFARLPDAHVARASLTGRSVTSDLGVTIASDTELAAVESTDLLFIGGGPGTDSIMEDADMTIQLRRLGAEAQWVTSVCTGALVLGAAGLLQGYRAATHWAAMEALTPLGAIPTHERVVIDRNRITGGGVTAGLDFALTVTQKAFGDGVAQAMQLACEYAPAPPFDSGHPDRAPTAILDKVRARFAPSRQARIEIAQRAGQKLTDNRN